MPSPADEGRFELLRAVGAVTVALPGDADHLLAALGLPSWSRAEHTEVFTLELPPYASVHLGPEGKLGGEGADRVAGLWRSLGLDPPTDADHLHGLLSLYAQLGEASSSCETEAARRRLDHARTTLLWEHLWPWVPAYLEAVERQYPAAASWAALTGQVLEREAMASPPARALPLALRGAPPPLRAEERRAELLDALVVPVRTGFLLTASDLAVAAAATGCGLRRGERRYSLQAMVDQDAAGTLGWLSEHASTWAERHRRRPAVAFDPARFFAERAANSAEVLGRMARRLAR